MHDLRRQALESGKTVSRKAQSKQSSRHSSRQNSGANSRSNSRTVSRQGSDEEDGNLSDDTTWSVNSIDEILTSEDLADTLTDEWREDLGDRIDAILERKRSSIASREEALSAYVRILTAKYAREEIHHKISELVTAFMRSIKAESSEKETVLALKALALTLITDPLDTIYDAATKPLQNTITDSTSFATKTSAIHALGICTFYGGASVEEVTEIMSSFLAIVESDGESAGAADSAEVVTAALEEWGFLATQLEDIEDDSPEAMDAFIEQLDSSEASVQIAAGENIALVYEKSYTPLEDDEEAPDAGDAGLSDPEEETPRNAEKLVKRYDPYRQPYLLTQKLSALASISSRRLSKKDKKSLHTNFSDILNSVENPTRGPRYQKAVDQETGKRYGSRMVVRIHKTGSMRIDRWWKLLRLKALRRALGGGFIIHYVDNEVVFESLPIMITNHK